MNNKSIDSNRATFSGKPAGILNKDIPVLTEVLCIMQDITQLERRREWQHGRLFNITQHLSGMPGGNGMPAGLEEAFAVISDLEKEHEERCKAYARQLRKAQKILNDIESRSMRTFVMMKYIMNMPDTKIREELNMSKRGFYRAKIAVEMAPNMAGVRWQERYILLPRKNKK